jgi:putative multiple sugar transport system ATP-binding protein
MSEYILEVEALTKEFPGVRALDEVNFRVKRGEIHCLCGENGAGKSTLMNIVSGVHSRDTYEGTIRYRGEPIAYRSVRDSEHDRIAIIHQELALSPYLPIYENVFLGHTRQKAGVINWNQVILDSKPFLDKVGLKENPSTVVSKLGVGKQQLVEIAKALSKNVELLILDEPTASLNDEESGKLLDLILDLKAEGITCIMISHKLNEVMKVADSITVLRDGRTISSHDLEKETITEEIIIQKMVGRDMTHRFPPKSHVPGAEVVMEVEGWTVYHPDFPELAVVRDADFSVRRGEILAFCGPMGAGRTELMMSIFGRSYGSHCRGRIRLGGREVELKTPRDAIRAGLGYLSEDRKELGLILIQNVKTNISNSSLGKLSRLGVILGDEETRAAEQYREQLNIRTPSILQMARNLSGGNQQKVVLSRCLLAEPEIFIVDEPTRGIDVGAKYEIYGILQDLAAAGKSVIMVTSELPEAIGIADRIYVMNEGRIKGELSGQDASQELIMGMALRNEESQEAHNGA